jgi:hypothetical protein
MLPDSLVPSALARRLNMATSDAPSSSSQIKSILDVLGTTRKDSEEDPLTVLILIILILILSRR